MAAMSKYMAEQFLDWQKGERVIVEMQTDGSYYTSWSEPELDLPEVSGAAAAVLGVAAVVAKNPTVTRRFWQW